MDPRFSIQNTKSRRLCINNSCDSKRAHRSAACGCLESLATGLAVSWRPLGLLRAKREHLLPSKRSLMGSDHNCTLPWRLDLVAPSDLTNMFQVVSNKAEHGSVLETEKAPQTHKSSSPVAWWRRLVSSTLRWRQKQVSSHLQERLTGRGTKDVKDTTCFSL